MIDERVERCARAGYIAVMRQKGDASLPFEPWEKLSEHWRKIYRVQTVAVLNESMADSTLTASVTTSQASFNFGALS